MLEVLHTRGRPSRLSFFLKNITPLKQYLSEKCMCERDVLVLAITPVNLTYSLPRMVVAGKLLVISLLLY